MKIEYKVTLDVQMNFKPGVSAELQAQDCQTIGRIFIEEGLVDQDLQERQDKNRDSLGLIPTLASEPIVELI